MARSVVLKGAPRCDRCQLPPRWCICDGLRPVELPVRVDVLMHYMEAYRPSSTGHLLNRIVPGAGCHAYRPEAPVRREDVAQPGRTLWVLHPQGDPMPADTPPENLQVVLLDGSWRQAAGMLRDVETWGRRVRLPMEGRSRYWLRSQQGEGRFSTFEALLFLLGALGLGDERARLGLQFELHVYAGLLSRGRKALAAEFLEGSPVRDALPDLVRRLSPPPSVI